MLPPGPRGNRKWHWTSLCGVRTLWLRPGVPWSSPVHAEQAGAQWGHVVCSGLSDLFGKSRVWLAHPSQVSGQTRDIVSLQGLISPPHEVMEAGSLRQAHDLASQKLQALCSVSPDTELDLSSSASGCLVEDTVSVEESMLII